MNPQTFEWIGKSAIGKRCLVQHYNNSLSPAYVDDDLAKKFPHMPNKAKERSVYPTAKERVLSNNEYRRFWTGWRSTDFNPDSVLNDRIVKLHNAHKPTTMDSRFPVKYWFSLDTAQAQEDRNRILICADGIDEITREWTWGIVKSIVLPAVEDIKTLNYKTVEAVLALCKEYRMDSGIMDWSNMTGIWASGMFEINTQADIGLKSGAGVIRADFPNVGNYELVLDATNNQITTTLPIMKVNSGVVEGVEIGYDGADNVVRGYGLPLRIAQDVGKQNTDFIVFNSGSGNDGTIVTGKQIGRAHV